MSLPYVTDYAKSNKAICRGCDLNIVKNTLRMAIMGQARQFDGLVPNWYHFHCFFIEHMPDNCNEIENFNSLKWEDQKEIENIIAKGESPFAAEDKKMDMKRAISIANSKALVHEYKIDTPKNGQTKCDFCNAQIKKSEIRIKKNATKNLWYHLKCFEKIHTQIDFLECGNKIAGFNELCPEDQQLVVETLPGLTEEENETPKKKIRLSTDEPMSEEDTTKRNLDIMYKYRAELSENLNREELTLLLKHNKQLVPNKLDLILDRVSDMLTFGALERCRYCARGQLVFTDMGYKCVRGPSSTMSKCVVVQNPNRMFVDIPIELKLRHNCLYAYEYFERTREPPKSIRQPNSVTNGPLKTKNLILLGFDDAEKSALHSFIKSLSGRVVTEIRRSVFAIITTEEEVARNVDDMQLSKERCVYVVSKDFLHEVFEKDNMDDVDEIWTLDELARKHSLVEWGNELHNRVPEKYARRTSRFIDPARLQQEEREGKRRMVIKGGIAIEPDSGLETIAHVYQSGDCKFNAVLGRTNYENNQNTYYKIQLLEADETEDYWVFRGWGRIGTTVGSFNTKKCNSLKKAKEEFKSTFKRMTGHSWDNRYNMDTSNGSYTMIEVNYDVRKEEIKDLYEHIADSSLKPAVAELMAIIFNVQAMEKMMLEYQLDLNKMPLGKLSRSQISTAYNILTQATSIIKYKKKSRHQIIEITNQFYSHMPHSTALARPPLLDNLKLVKKKSDMLADLMELETAYAMIQRGAEGAGGNILDGYYKQLNTDIEVVNENSDEFKLIQEYVTNTHADTHRNYDLKILEIFKINRNGEKERFEPYKKLNNRRLLWHGSRTTNFAGILSQGLRIAPPEAPQTGYMFGKGIYFADMVSKSANYCYTTQEDRVGLMLLCEVALGNMVDKLDAETVTSLPNGINSVRGVGKTEPDAQQMKTLEDGVQVPLGKPVTDIDCNSVLLYNEYIVYDVSQVNIKYLLKMDFKYKTRRH